RTTGTSLTALTLCGSNEPYPLRMPLFARGVKEGSGRDLATPAATPSAQITRPDTRRGRCPGTGPRAGSGVRAARTARRAARAMPQPAPQPEEPAPGADERETRTGSTPVTWEQVVARFE